MTRKKAHIISHSHWDREWFLPLESLRFRLVTLMDEVEALLDKEDGFHHFHMDGQMIMLEDYLAVKPAKREKNEAAGCGRKTANRTVVHVARCFFDKWRSEYS